MLIFILYDKFPIIKNDNIDKSNLDLLNKHQYCSLNLLLNYVSIFIDLQ